MELKRKKIRPDDHRKDHRKHPSQHPSNSSGKTGKEKAQFITIGIGLVVVALLLFGIFSLMKSLDFSGIIFSFGKNLRTDANGRTNILLAGIGGEGHDGGNLTDTIIVASIDYDKKMVSMLSIPRDLYVKSGKLQTGERINQIYSVGKSKINSQAGMEALTEIASGITGLKIDYYAKVDFSGFEKIVDSIGGVDVVVEKDIYDPYYPLGETTHYQTFSIKAGPQHLDGATALKYARSRKTTSDFDRAKRQQQLLTAIKEKALSLNILTDPSKIQAIYDSLKDSVETNFTVDEIIQLAKISKDFGKENISTHVLSDDPTSCGGFLYTPAREYFSGAFVLLPAGKNYDSINEMTDLIFNHADAMESETPIQVLNGTSTGNLAGEVTDYLDRLCFNVVYYGNADTKDHTDTTVYYQPGPKGEKPAVVDLIAKFLNFKEVAGIPASYLDSDKKAGTQVVIEIGEDYLKNRLQNPFNVLPYLVAPKTDTGSEQTSSQENNT